MNKLTQNINLNYSIDTEATEETLKYLPEYLQRYYLLQHKDYRTFRNVQIEKENEHKSLHYNVIVPKTSEHVNVQVIVGNPIKVNMTPSNSSIDKKFLDQLYEDLFLIVQLFEEEARKATLYFAFMQGEKIIPEKQKHGIRIRLFSDSMLSLYIGLIALTFFLFYIIGPYAPIVFVFISFGIAIFSGKLLANSADWKITQQQPEILMLQYKLSKAEQEKYAKDPKAFPQIRKEIFDSTLGSNKPLSCETANSVFTKYGIKCDSQSFAVKQVNLYNIVKRVTTKFKLPIPKIVVTNSVIPNAAAAGPSPKLGTVIITTGILTQLEEDELESVIGHEISHLKSRDPLIMSTLSSIEFLLRFYVFLPFLLAYGFLSFWIYLFAALGLIYFFGKILEGRADLDSAIIIGNPKAMAEALRKIGFRSLFPLNKREPEFWRYRFLEWLRLDPHPPIYFRVERLENLKDPEKIKNTFLQSIKDNFKGLVRA